MVNNKSAADKRNRFFINDLFVDLKGRTFSMRSRYLPFSFMPATVNIVHDFFICASSIAKEGEMRRQLGANKNQSVRIPCLIHSSIIFLLVSKESNSTASHKPNDRMAFMFGPVSNDLNRLAFCSTVSISLSSNKTFMAAMPAAQQTG